MEVLPEVCGGVGGLVAVKDNAHERLQIVEDLERCLEVALHLVIDGLLRLREDQLIELVHSSPQTGVPHLRHDCNGSFAETHHDCNGSFACPQGIDRKIFSDTEV